MIGQFTYEHHTPTDDEKKVMRYIEERRTQMNTDYRKELVEMAEWSKGEYDAIPKSRINNLDLFKTGLSRAAVNHRLVMLYDNPSNTIYKAVEDSDQHRVEIIKQLDKSDKNVGRFDAIHQQIERTANIEGTAVGMLLWHENIDDDNVVNGDFCTMIKPIPIKDFYWDESGIFLNGNSAFTCNDAAYGEVMSMIRFRCSYSGKDFKNVDAVLPNKNQPDDVVYRDDWEEGRYSTDGDFVYVFTYKCKKFPENGKFVDKEFIIANGQVIYNGEMREPWINGEKWLPFFKIEGIPTGGFGGLGIPALIRHPQEALDRMVTMAEAQAELAVNPVLFYQTTGELLPDTIDYFPGAAYPYKGTGNGITNDLQFFQQPDITAGAQYIIDKMVNFITIITGIDIQALLDTSASELAIQTQNKREIQEKILKMSVLWNETHGWTDMSRLRLAYLQEYYPVMRIQRVLGKNGVLEDSEPEYPKIKVSDYVVKKSYAKGNSEKVQMLEKRDGAYSSLSITPDEVRFPLDVYIESSQIATGIDTVKQNKWDKMLDSLARVPGIQDVIDSEKTAKGTVKNSGFQYSDVLQDRLAEIDDDTHPARSEFKAILVSDVIPFEPIVPKDYKPEEYLYIYRDMMKLPEYKKTSDKIKTMINEQLSVHMKNFVDPMFKIKQKQQKDAMVKQEAQANQATGNTLKAIGGSNEQPTDLAGRTKSEAAKIGDETKKAKAQLN